MRTLRTLLVLLWATVASASGPASTTHLWSPIFPTAGIGSAFPATNTLRCTAWVPDLGITAATKIAFFVTAGLGGGALCSVSIYNFDGSSRITTTGAQSCAATAAVVTTGLTPFSLTEGTKYQVCLCANASGGTYLTGLPVGSALTDLENAVSPPNGSDAANACAGAVAPGTTGGLTPVAASPPVVLLMTDTP